MGRVFPREWDEFVALIPGDERDGDLAAAYVRLLADPDAGIRAEAARRWCAWEDTHVSLVPGWTHLARYDDPRFRAVFARLVTHYWGNGCFLEDDEVLDNMHRIADIPAVLVHVSMVDTTSRGHSRPRGGFIDDGRRAAWSWWMTLVTARAVSELPAEASAAV